MTTEYIDVTPDWGSLRETFLREWQYADRDLRYARGKDWQSNADSAAHRAADAARMLLVLHGIELGGVDN